MPKQRTSPLKSAQQGVVLIEAMIAILIFSIGVLGIVGMQAAMVKNTSDSKYRADAAYIAQQRLGEIWADPANAAPLVKGFDQADFDISALLPGGKRTTIQAGTQFTITVGWTAPGETPAADATTAPCFMAVAHCYITIANVAF